MSIPSVNSPIVSIVITTYNRQNLVRRSIDSVLKQSYRNIEVIIVDDGSTNGTLDLLKQYESDPRVRIIPHSKNRGASAAKNTGLDAASGEFITIVDSDDEILQNTIETLVDEFSRLGNSYGMIFGNCQNPATGMLTGFGLESNTDVSYADVICGKISGEHFGMWRSELTRGLRFDETILGNEDLIWHKIYQMTKVHYIHKVLRYYYIGVPGQLTELKTDPVWNERVAKSIERYLEVYGEDILRICPCALATHFKYLTFHYKLATKTSRALVAALQAFRYKPTLASGVLLFFVFTPRRILIPLLQRRQAKRLSIGLKGK